AAEDRGLLINRLRNVARLAALDAPGLQPVQLASSGADFVPSPATERVLNQNPVLRKLGLRGRQAIRDGRSYAAGVNAYWRHTHQAIAPFTPRDETAISSLSSRQFAGFGGNEVANSELLSALQARLGRSAGKGVFRDLTERLDPERPVTAPGRFPYEPV